MKEVLKKIFILTLIAGFLYGCGKSADKVMAPAATESATYVGSDTCGKCHQSIYSDFKQSGHPYKLRKVSDVLSAPSQGLPEISLTPDCGVSSWDALSYVIGGFKWKARFIDNNGYIVTGNNSQYNLADGSFSAYQASDPCGTKQYNCGKCHTTGYSSSGNQGGLTGIAGTWVFEGIQCERCHGAGSRHVNYREDMTIDDSSEFCGNCHSRPGYDINSPNVIPDAVKIPAKNGFIEHHEQYQELLASRMTNFKCITCHDPHKKAEYSIKVSCESCHQEQANSIKNSTSNMYTSGNAPDCISCHMTEATKSAKGDISIFKGDVKTHLFAIRGNDMFTPDGKLANGFIAIEYACTKCHSKTRTDFVNAIASPKEVHSNPSW